MRILCSEDNVLDAVLMETLEKAACCCVENEGLMPDNAEEFGHSKQREIVYLFVHSVCHLLGYDHMEPDEKAEMREAEEKVMSFLGIERV